MLFFGAAANELTRGLGIAKELERSIYHWTRLSDTLSEVEGVRSAATLVVRVFDSALTAARFQQLSEEDPVGDSTLAMLKLLRAIQQAVGDLDQALDVDWGRGEQDPDRQQVRRLSEAAAYATDKTSSALLDVPIRAAVFSTAEPESKGKPRMVRRSKASRRLADWATRILPVADRPEYAELFHAELHDLAESGCGRRAQIAYALRVLVRAPWLRRELSAPVRERSW